VGVLSPLSSSEPKVTAADEEEFRRLLVEVQTAWSRQDIQKLRRIVTPEMCEYFSDKLSENVSGGVENRVEDVVVTRADLRESWAEDARLYATVLLQWNARDYMQSLTKSSPDDTGKAGDRPSCEFAEAWTFVRHRDGKWLLSAIQEVS
jgi:predicted lipid-binding transport protein (Tim44 family)